MPLGRARASVRSWCTCLQAAYLSRKLQAAKADFAALNARLLAEAEASGKEARQFANPRNAAAGSLRPKDAAISEAEIDDALARRKAARAEKDFATSDAIRDELAGKGVEVMDGDPLGWEWRL